jgi:hypothetical protein
MVMDKHLGRVSAPRHAGGVADSRREDVVGAAGDAFEACTRGGTSVVLCG